jgi:DNA mismatch endonuclease (patch repair protein)
MKTTPQRSALMRRVGRKDTAPEISVRRHLHRAGLRYRLHVRTLPGTPDIVLPRHRTVVFVNGCFWHGHRCKHGAVRAKTNTDFWGAKITANKVRDQRKRAALQALGWSVECVWECQCGNAARLDALCTRIGSRSRAD